ncbi:Hypothetical protein CAP_7482 [Chondromyces apiculatus DSM 436]|uniref:Uncharacterized protein n=1 Tax=Chondromyces apiculatus DSM 436 TaxID=1192034 RepID=A0A017SZG6_9BACT|nr:Hypothetical protein CAP_7482 [Chondromyces apiculatus DSM 436]
MRLEGWRAALIALLPEARDAGAAQRHGGVGRYGTRHPGARPVAIPCARGERCPCVGCAPVGATHGEEESQGNQEKRRAHRRLQQEVACRAHRVAASGIGR